MIDAQSMENIENIDKHLKLAPLIPEVVTLVVHSALSGVRTTVPVAELAVQVEVVPDKPGRE